VGIRNLSPGFFTANSNSNRSMPFCHYNLKLAEKPFTESSK
jgi:hypothetical protein